MGRVRRTVLVEGQPFWALFDTGARNTYVIEEVAALLTTVALATREPVALAGQVHQVERVCLLSALVEGLPIHLEARVLPEIGTDEQGRRIHVLLGALAMQQWGITPVPQEERLDTTHYPREFVEFFETATNEKQPLIEQLSRRERDFRLRREVVRDAPAT